MSLSFFSINYISIHIILFIDILLNALFEYEAVFVNASTLLSNFQVFVQLYGLVTILLLIGTTRNFQIGAWRKVSRQFRGAIIVNVSYVLITIALHIVTHRKYEHFLLRLAISLAQKAT
ncbi:unnamed protein product [Albugo candida]|uniref:Uncharacterized protein n=1 Tax=Albugo candida TaxID=65357 RepID=A0A024GMF6_9STRA|nr:unnamed protein product [Albugo candida]|eukprot:CCI47522.1 unnamed protein product [Albugo candida]